MRMRKVRVAGLLAVAVAVVVASLLWRGEAPSDEPGRATPSEVATPTLAERANALLTAPLPPAKGDRVIRGRVLGLDGPVEGAVVVASTDSGEEVLSDLPCRCGCSMRLLECGCADAAGQLVELVLERRGEAPPIARATSSADGSFTLEGLEDGVFALWAEKPGKLIGLRRGVKAGDEAADVEISEGITLRGKTVGDEGKPVSALVTAIYAKQSRFFDAVSGKDGTFTIGPVPVGAFAVVASAAGLLPAHGNASPGEPDLKELKLHAPRRIAGTVTRDGVPVARATVSLEGGHKKAKADTDAKGRFEFSGLSPLAYQLLAVEGYGQAQESVELKAGKDVLDVQLSLTRGGDIVGSVKSESGTAIADAKLTASGKGRDPSRRATPDGRFRLGPMPPGKYLVGVQAEGFLTPDTSEVEVTEGATANLELVLRAASLLKGMVVDEEGHPVEEATVMARPPQPPARERDEAEDVERGPRPRQRHSYGQASSHQDGKFSVDGLEPGQYVLVVRHDEYRDAELTVTAPTTGARIVLSHGLEIVGTVVDEDDKPVVGATVSAGVDDEAKEVERAGRGEYSPPKSQKATGVRGEFRVRGLEAGHYLVTATQGGQREPREAHAKVEVRQGTPPTVRLQFEKGLAISGKVVTKSGAPVAEARIVAFPDLEEVERPTREEMRERSKGGAATSAEDGTFSVKHLKPGAFLVSASSMAGNVEEPVKANAGDTDLKLVLEGGGKVRGRVVQASGEPITHFKINLREQRDDQGAFEQPIPGPGDQELVVQAEGLAEVVRKYQSKGGQDVDLGDLVMSAGRVVTGKVVDALSGDAVVGALVDVCPPEHLDGRRVALANDAGAVTTRADGSFTLPHVEARPLAIVATHETHLRAGQPLAPEATTVTLRMDRGASVVGSVTDSAGKPIPKAMVSAGARQDHLRAMAGADGRYRLAPVPRGQLPLMVWARSHEFRARIVDVPASGEVQADFSETTGGAHVLLVMSVHQVPMLLPGDVPLPAKEEDFDNLGFMSIDAQPTEQEQTLEASHVAPGQYTVLVLEQNRSSLFKVARQLVQIGPEPEQKFTVRPGAFVEIKVTGQRW